MRLLNSKIIQLFNGIKQDTAWPTSMLVHKGNWKSNYWKRRDLSISWIFTPQLYRQPQRIPPNLTPVFTQVAMSRTWMTRYRDLAGKMMTHVVATVVATGWTILFLTGLTHLHKTTTPIEIAGPHGTQTTSSPNIAGTRDQVGQLEASPNLPCPVCDKPLRLMRKDTHRRPYGATLIPTSVSPQNIS